ncbi:uncharacterized protein TrAtP1_000968 [Trichoderma atroviride]|uniref:Uncharacterized protein n=1 Tax=Hypocrea atroviridis (strain ATCC 20476 / IMI 206040) TaxID=452589 RepID=G9NMU6_HYPAI|nr:Hypothetical protein TRIATDRAFT_281902 [Trichoderma atroviride IMI 206040]EHK48226.1 Hypothetical protein TRIATDRAFT_281902 [Trichoderma atroviride IMI 206040]UKZ59667.1 hypothetical protein TrAtP1_000968 [Trichoderma atroviride]
MAGSSSAPALVATFVFGLVVLAASAAIFFFVKANRSPLLRDELRLALVVFLATSTLWGILEFAATLVSHNVTSACQVAISFATVFDQLARFSVEQFLLWGVNGGMKVSKLSLVLQGGLFLRFILGAVFVGVQRPQFDTVCVATNLILPIGIVVMVVDIAMVMILGTKAFLAKKSDAIRPELSRTNTLILITVGLGMWTALSTPLFLGLKSTGLAVRTILPAIGLLILIGIVALTARSFVPPPSTSGLQIQKTVSFESTIELPTRNLETREFPSQTAMERINGALPLISHPPFGQASRGIGGLPVEGELFPPMRAQTAPVRAYSRKKMTDRAYKGGKIVISKPIVQMDAETSNFDNIPTIDLATAAMKEKERRELMPQNPFVNVDIGLGKAPSPTEVTRKLSAAKRKQVPESAAPSNSRNLLTVDEPAFAMTSAVQLSPGPESARRRSPRHQRDGSAPSPPIISPKEEARTPKSAPLQSVPAALAAPPPPPIPSLQKRLEEDRAMSGTAAASHFSVSTMDPMTARIASTMMFSPEGPKSAKVAAPRPPPRPPAPAAPPASVDQVWVDPRTATLPRSNSVKNNIRPSRQRPPSLPAEEEKPDTKTPLQRRATVGLPNNPRARATRVFGGERGTVHERQIMFMNSEEDTVPILAAAKMEAEEESESESPTRKSMIHRPRPIPRKSTASASELLGLSIDPAQDDLALLPTPNMPLISPVSVKSLSQSTYGATSPGSLTRVKTVRRTSFVPDLPVVPVEYQSQQSKVSQDPFTEETTTNVWTVVPNEGLARMPSTDKKTRALCVSKFSVDTALTAQEPQSPYQSRLSVNTQSSYEETIGRNSTVAFSSDPKPARVSTVLNSFSERLTRHESVDSELSLMLRMAPVPPKNMPGEKRSVAQDESEAEDVPFIIDIPTPESPRSMESDVQLTVDQLPSWHHRVGEELPSFSSQLKIRRSRKLLVPKPLALYRPANVTVVIEAEPSPEEPAQEALDKIHEQLKHLDLENGDARATISEKQRQAILANLESEMGAQEDQWQMLRVDYSQGSPSTTVSASEINSLRSSVDISKFEIMPITKLNASAGDLLVALKEHAENRLSTSSDQLSKEETLDSGDEKLNRRSLSASGKMNLLSVNTRTMSQIGSPTPPDTDESGAESDNDSMVEGLGAAKDGSTALMPRATSFLALDEVLSPFEDVQNKSNAPVEFEDVSLMTPKALPAPIVAQPEETMVANVAIAEAETIKFSLADLEESSPVSAPVPAPAPRPRQVIRRPPRQSKRISTLPDIVENPQPLVGKSGNLGIFQFPWGEKSDLARIPPRMVGISGTMTSGRAPMNSIQEKKLPPAPQTFLDDDEFENGLDDYENEEYDDGFDEATLWEIASLLESDLDTSRDDLFMVGEEDWADQAPAEDELSPASSPVRDVVVESVKEEVYDFVPGTLASSESSSDISLQVPTLWTADMKDSRMGLGLPQPSEGEWQSYFAIAPRQARTVRRVVDEPTQLSSVSLWTATATDASMYTSGVWRAPETKAVKSASKIVSLVWSPLKPTNISSLGLPQPVDSLWTAYIPEATRVARKTTQMPQPPVITSTSLWSLKRSVKSSASAGVWTHANEVEAEQLTAATASVWTPLSRARVATVGLPQPELSVWDLYISPLTRSSPKAARMLPPATIETTSLWKQSPAVKHSASNGVWSLVEKIETEVLTTTAASLWSLSSRARTTVGLPQPEPSVWKSYIPVVARPAPKAARMLPPAVIETTSLWKLSSVTKSSVSQGVWSPALKEEEAIITPEASSVASSLWLPISAPRGNPWSLPQPDIQAWAAYISTDSRVARRAPQAQQQQQVTIQTSSMWSIEPSRTIEMFSSANMWSLKITTLLWAPAVSKDAGVGLSQPDAKVWNAYIALPSRSTHRAVNVSEAENITSTSLWQPLPTAVPYSGGVWAPKSLVAKTSHESHAETSLKVAKALWASSPEQAHSVGLPQPDAKVWDMYLLLPARDYRKAYLPRPGMITSTSLWRPLPAAIPYSGAVWAPKSLIAKPSPAKTSQMAKALWSPSPEKTRSVGLSQPDAQVWDMYLLLPAREYRKAYLPRPSMITSTSLWAPTPSVETPSGGVWKAKSAPLTAKSSLVKPALAVVEDLLWSSSPAKAASFGLPQPDAEFWNAYLVPAGRRQRVAHVPKTVVTITSTSLWTPTLSTKVPSTGVWQPKSIPVNVPAKQPSRTSIKTKKISSSLWTQLSTAKPSVGLPQPISDIWNAYISPLTSAMSTSRRVFVSETTSIESQALWSLPSKTEAAAGSLWCPAETKRPVTQTVVRAVTVSSSPATATPTSVAAESSVSSEARKTSVRKSVPVLMTQEQWNSAFKRISQDVKRDDSSLNQWALPSSSSSKNVTRLNRSQSVKSRPVFDPSVMALISEYPSATTSSSSTSSSRKGLGRSKSISALPSSRRTLSRSNSSKASIVEPQPAAFLWTKPASASDKASSPMWQPPRRSHADVQLPPSFSILLLPSPRRTAGRKTDIAIPTSFRSGQGLWRGAEQIRL